MALNGSGEVAYCYEVLSGEGPEIGLRGSNQVLNVVAWSAQAACRDTDPDEMFVQGAAQNRVKQICNGCPVKMECLADALDNRIEFGVWGGMTERERRALLRKRPHVKSWTELLQSAATRQIPAQSDARRHAFA